MTEEEELAPLIEERTVLLKKRPLSPFLKGRIARLNEKIAAIRERHKGEG